MHAAPQTSREDDLISAFLDGELSGELAQAALRRAVNNPDDRRRFEEYCAAGDALRGLSGRSPDLTDRVMAALEREPTLLAPMPQRRLTPRPPLLWASAAAVAAITWGLWSVLPQQEVPMPMAMQAPSNHVSPYLAAHQDYAQAVLAPTEMQFTRVSLVEAGR